MFERTFDEGMALVEETARYLDGQGREEARDLPRKSAMLYAGESMRVTTRLMQAASWLLVQRAVHDGDMEPDQASSATAIAWAPRKSAWARRPKASRICCRRRCSDLLERSDNLYRRIARLDDVLFGRERDTLPGAHAHWNRLEQAFGASDSTSLETKKAARSDRPFQIR